MKRPKGIVIKRATNAKLFYNRAMLFSDQIKETF